MKTTYLDFQATTPLDPRVLDAMLPWLTAPSNPHASENEPGRLANEAVEDARDKIAAALGGRPENVVFTSGATEAVNIVLRSLVKPTGHLVISAVEHPCVAETAAELQRHGSQVTTIPVDAEGLLMLEELERALDRSPDLVSVMAVNNEVGTVQPTAQVALMCRDAEVPFHSDAAQAVGRIPIKLGAGLSTITISGHKIYGPQGIGAVLADGSTTRRLRPIATGGGQQRGLRPGTVPVALCVGLGEACRLAVEEMDKDRVHSEVLRDLFLELLEDEVGPVQVHGSLEERVPHNLNISIAGVQAQELLARAPELALSTGSACSSGAIEPSRVLRAMGLDNDAIEGAVRLGFGRTNTKGDAFAAAEAIGRAARDCLGRLVTGVGA